MLDSDAVWLVVGAHDLRSSVLRPAHWQVTVLRCPAGALNPAVDGAHSYVVELAGWSAEQAWLVDQDGRFTRRTPVSPAEVLAEAPNLCFGLLRPSPQHTLRLYGHVDSFRGQARFLTLPEPPAPVESAVPALVAAMDVHYLKTGNFRCFRVKEKPDVEFEHKFTLPGHPDCFELARDVLRLAGAGGLPGFVVEFREEIQHWDFVNHIHAIEQPAAEAGYVAFIPTTDGRHTVKRKIFAADTDERIELHSKGIDVGSGPDRYDRHVRDVLGLTPDWTASFRRIRYDVAVESIETGNVIALVFDRCAVIDADGHRIPGRPELSQCELEYIYSQAMASTSFESVRADMARLRELMTAYFDERGIEHRQDHESKLTFLRNQRHVLPRSA